MTDDPKPGMPANLRYLRVLVTVLTATMILGLITIVALFVIRFTAAAPALPEAITLPDGTKATAFTQASDWYAVVTHDDRILIFSRATGALVQEVTIETGDATAPN